MKGCIQCLRIILVIFNFILVLIGLAILGFFIFVCLEPEAQDIILALGQYQVIQILLYVMMGIGGATLIIALFGCCGAYHESQCLLGSYFIILIIIFSMQVGAATLGYLYHDKILESVDERMLEGIDEYSMLRGQRQHDVPFMDSIQRILQCCGRNSYLDYQESIPMACCNRFISNCLDLVLSPDVVFKDGCRDKYKAMLKDKLMMLFLAILSIAAFEIFCLLFAMIMCCTVRQYYLDYYGADYSINT